jgi:hypothetical protein
MLGDVLVCLGVDSGMIVNGERGSDALYKSLHAVVLIPMRGTSTLGRMGPLQHIESILWGCEHHLCVLLVLSSVLQFICCPVSQVNCRKSMLVSCGKGCGVLGYIYILVTVYKNMTSGRIVWPESYDQNA